MISRATPSARRRRGARHSLLVLLAGFPVSSSSAGELTVTATSDPVVVTLDGRVVGTTPLEAGPLPAGVYELGVRASPLAANAFSRRLEVPATGGVAVRVDWARQWADVAPLAAGADARAESSPPGQPAGELYVAAEAPGAAVWLDGVDTGRITPVLLPSVPAGVHAVEVRTACARASGKPVIVVGQISRVELVLQEGQGALDVRSDPPDATVLLDDLEVGRTPYATASVACGAHRLALRAPGHVEAAMTIETPAFETTALTISLEAQAYGALVVAPTPLEAVVEVDGVTVGAGPRTIAPIGAGEHQVRVSVDGYVPDARTIAVAPDATTRIDVILQRPPAPRPQGRRIALSAAVTAGGLAAAGLAGWTYAEAHQQFQTYLTTRDDGAAAAFYDAEVAPRRTAAVIEGIAALGLLGTGAGLWITTELALTPAPGGLVLSGRW
jgi:hypothetical protein